MWFSRPQEPKSPPSRGQTWFSKPKEPKSPLAKDIQKYGVEQSTALARERAEAEARQVRLLSESGEREGVSTPRGGPLSRVRAVLRSARKTLDMRAALGEDDV